MLTKPAIVAFPGAWHPATTIDPFTQVLRDRGYEAHAHQLRSVGNASAGKAEDIAYVRSVLVELIEQGKDVILLCHSFAGVICACAIQGLHKKERAAQGHPAGGLIGIIYMAAFIPSPALTGPNNPPIAPWWKINGETGFIVLTDEANDTLYHDCPPDVAAAVIKTLQDHSIKSAIDPAPESFLADASFDGSRGYIFCKHDRALKPVLQQEMIDTSELSWIVKEMDTGHSPFLAKPAALADVIEEFVGEFQSKQNVKA